MSEGKKRADLADLDGFVPDDPGSFAETLGEQDDENAELWDKTDAVSQPATLPSAGIQVRAPKVITVAPATDERSALEKYAGVLRSTYSPALSAAKDAGQWLADTVTGVGQGVTRGLGDDIAARAMPEYKETGIPVPRYTIGEGEETTQRADDAMHIPRIYAAGSADEDAAQAIESGINEARKENPTAVLSGEIGGGVATTPPIGKLAGPLAKFAMNAARNAAEGGVSSYGHSSADGYERAMDGVRGAGFGAAGSVALDGIAAASGKLGKLAAPPLQRFSSYLRGKATGIMPHQSKRLMEAVGEEGIPDLGNKLEASGMHLNKFGFPTSAAGVNANAARAVEESGKQIASLVEQMATVEGVQKPTSNVLAQGWQVVKKMDRDAVLGDELRAAALAREEMNNISNKFGKQEMMNVSEIHSLKRKLQSLVYDATKVAKRAVAPERGATKKAEALAGLDANMRGQLYDLVEDPAAKWGGASEESARQFRKSMSDYGNARAIQKASAARAGNQAGLVPLGLLGTLGASAGIGSSMAGDDSDARTMVTRGLMGAALPVLANRYGANYGATGMKGLAALANAASRVGKQLGRVPVGSLVGTASGLAEPKEQDQNTLGHTYSENAKRMLAQDPSAFGPYSARLSAAAAEGSTALAVEMDKLSRDELWTTKYKPLIREQGEDIVE